MCLADFSSILAGPSFVIGLKPPGLQQAPGRPDPRLRIGFESPHRRFRNLNVVCDLTAACADRPDDSPFERQRNPSLYKLMTWRITDR